MSITLKESRLIDACPPSISEDVETQAICQALDRQFRELIDDINQVVIYPWIDEIENDDLLDLLGWQFHVDFWDKSAPRAIKKTLIKTSLDWHTRKGTVALIQDALDFYFGAGQATLQEWFDYKRPFPPNYPIDDPGGLGTWHDRYRFRVLMEENVIPEPEVETRLRQLIVAYKPVSRWDEGIIRQRPTNCEIFVGIAALGWKQITIEAPSLARGPLFVSRLDPNRGRVNTQIELHVYGANFSATSQIVFDGPQATVFYDAGHLSASLELGPVLGNREVFVSEAGVADSNRLVFECHDEQRILVLDRVEPSPVIQGTATLDYYGSGFSENSIAWFRANARLTTPIDSTHLVVGPFQTGGSVNGINAHVREAGLPNSNIILVDIVPAEEEEPDQELPGKD